jgi:hypothetical protein
MQLVIMLGGAVRAIYSETIHLAVLGSPVIRRASYVEPTADGQWTADLRLVDGPVLGPFPRRSDALAAEQAWLEDNLLGCRSESLRPQLSTRGHVFESALSKNRVSA